MDLPRKSVVTRSRAAASWFGLLVCSAAAAWLAYAWSERLAFTRLDDAAARHLDLYASVIENELGKQAYLPGLLTGDADIEALLSERSTPALRDSVNRKLSRFTVTAGALSTFIVDAKGMVTASSDWYRADSPLGHDLSSQRYIADALNGEDTQLFSPSAARGSPEYIFAQPVTRDARVLGAVVARISLDPMEATWIDSAFRADSEKPLVVDDHGVVIMSSVRDWKFKSLRALPSAERALVVREDLYAKHEVAPLDLTVQRQLEHGAQLVLLPVSPNEVPTLRIIHERTIPKFGWRLLIVSNAADVWRNARYAAWGAGALVAFAILLLMYMLQRRRVMAQRLMARAALQRAYDELELKVAQRTAELQASNQELVQAGKLALLGQMSAGISHELGQPLTALRALSANARLLLERGQTETVQDNLDLIADLVERMGRITSQLKSFARKSGGSVADVGVAAAVANAQLLLHSRLREDQVDLICDVPDPLRVRCDGNRLEQVLVNLMANAIDAVRGCERKTIAVRAWEADERVMVRVSDTGAGIPSATRERLFEPFFTTKPAGEGLGLGLVISANIVQEFGGVLRAVDVELGAAFQFDLPLAVEVIHV